MIIASTTTVKKEIPDLPDQKHPNKGPDEIPPIQEPPDLLHQDGQFHCYYN